MTQPFRLHDMTFGGDELVDKEIAALITGLSVRTIEDWTSKRKLPIFYLGPRTVRYRVRELFEWVNQHAVIIETNKNNEIKRNNNVKYFTKQ